MQNREATGFRWASHHGLSIETRRIPKLPFLKHVRWANQQIPTGAIIGELHFTPGGLDFAHQDVREYASYHLLASINAARQLFQGLKEQQQEHLIPTYLAGITNREMAQAAQRLGFSRRGGRVIISTQELLTNPKLSESRTCALTARLSAQERVQAAKVPGIIAQRRQESNVFQRLLPYVAALTGGSFLSGGIGSASAVGALGLSSAAGSETIHAGYIASTAHPAPEKGEVFVPTYRLSSFQKVREFARKIFAKFGKRQKQPQRNLGGSYQIA